jgi:phosphoribosylglycinamide formyltransferase-1
MTAAAASALRLAVLISGRGSNMLAIARACARDPAAMQVATVISDQPEAAGIPAAREMGLDARVVAARDWRRTAGFDRAGFEGELQRHIDASGPHLVVLAGFMRILSPAFAGRYAGRLQHLAIEFRATIVPFQAPGGHPADDFRVDPVFHGMNPR